MRQFLRISQIIKDRGGQNFRMIKNIMFVSVKWVAIKGRHSTDKTYKFGRLHRNLQNIIMNLPLFLGPKLLQTTRGAHTPHNVHHIYSDTLGRGGLDLPPASSSFAMFLLIILNVVQHTRRTRSVLSRLRRLLAAQPAHSQSRLRRGARRNEDEGGQGGEDARHRRVCTMCRVRQKGSS